MITTIAGSWTRLPRWLLAVGDQGLVAIVNLALSVAVTRVSGIATLGRFAVVSATILLSLGLARLAVTDPWLASRVADRSPLPQLRWLVLVTAALTAASVAVVVALACGGDTRWYIACPISAAVVVQDFGRYVAFRAEQPAGALLSDAAVLVVGALTFALWSALGTPGLTAILDSWLIGLLAGTAAASPLVSGRISPAGAVRWWARYCRPLAAKLALDGVAFLVGTNASLYLLAYLATQKDVGMVRIVQTMFSPAALVVTGLTMWLVPTLANREAERAVRVRRRATVYLAGVSVPLILVAVAAGPWLARLVFKVDQAPGRLPLALAGVSALAMAVAAPWVASARVSGHYLPIAWTRAGGAAASLVGMAGLVALRGPTGYLGLLALQGVMITVTSVLIGVRASPNSQLRSA